MPIRLWDESRNAVNAIEMLQNGDYIIRSYENKPETWNLKPPLLTWLQVIAMHVVGLNEIAIRLPSILASMSSLFILFLWTFRLTKSYAFAFLGAGILATSAGFYG
ncbi:MAG TPA: 4-amino-4-deoxy-L-arabinose transferase, partial [Bacteroidetes bacterium]|nr:4-amino-4-deoxy-L-arabinose transferase [Bacteroidota bacterium]